MTMLGGIPGVSRPRVNLNIHESGRKGNELSHSVLFCSGK